MTSVTDNPAARRFELRVDGRLVGVLDYRPNENVLDLFHTEVEPGERNRGLGATLVRGALDDVRARGMRIVATCPFVAAVVRRHPEYADLLG